MRKVIFFTILICLSAAGVFAQKTQTTVRTIPKSVPVQQKILTEIADADWNILAKSLSSEDWNKSAALAAQYLDNLKTDNDKKQLAQLRYIYIYALTGKILDYNAQANALEAEKTWNELDRVMATFIGKEFVMPPRRFVENCDKLLNVICRVKDTTKAFRTTATNKEGNAIHSFDYVVFDEAVDIKEFDEKPTFLGGTLQKADYNEDKSKPWILRLFFNKGFVSVVVN
ncbi:MAG: hypothetical protein ABJA66_20925 [Actinomycetota bacterium]